MHAKELARLIHAAPRDRDGFARAERVVLDPRSTWPLRENDRLSFERVEFGAPLLGSFWTRPVFRTCVFVDVDLDGVNAARTSFVDCTFERLSLVAFVAGSRYGEIVDEDLLAQIPAAERAAVLERLFALRHLRA